MYIESRSPVRGLPAGEPSLAGVVRATPRRVLDR